MCQITAQTMKGLSVPTSLDFQMLNNKQAYPKVTKTPREYKTKMSTKAMLKCKINNELGSLDKGRILVIEFEGSNIDKLLQH